MWKNFIRVTIRSISKNKAFNVINIAGSGHRSGQCHFYHPVYHQRNQLTTGSMSGAR